MALVKLPTGKYAAFVVVDDYGTAHAAAIAFDWKRGGFYFPLVLQLSPGVWGAWVYDNTAGTWVPIGQLTLPVGWGKLAPSTTTTAEWSGSLAASCSAYPRAEVYFHPPVGFVGSSGTIAAAGANGSGAGDCPAEIGTVSGNWTRYRLGADTLGAS